MPALPWRLRGAALAFTEPGPAPMLVCRMGLLEATFDRTVDTSDDALPVPFLDREGVRTVGTIWQIVNQLDGNL